MLFVLAMLFVWWLFTCFVCLCGFNSLVRQICLGCFGFVLVDCGWLVVWCLWVGLGWFVDVVWFVWVGLYLV